MRDDIHKKLPLPRPWKRLLRACTRDADRERWSAYATQVVVYELNQLTPAVVRQLQQSAGQPNLFGGPDRVASALACNPIDHAAILQAAATNQSDRDAAIHDSVGRAVESLLESQLREVRVHTALEDPAHSAELNARVGHVIRAADVPRLVADRLAGEKLPATKPSPLDLDEDLRGKK